MTTKILTLFIIVAICIIIFAVFSKVNKQDNLYNIKALNFQLLSNIRNPMVNVMLILGILLLFCTISALAFSYMG